MNKVKELWCVMDYEERSFNDFDVFSTREEAMKYIHQYYGEDVIHFNKVILNSEGKVICLIDKKIIDGWNKEVE